MTAGLVRSDGPSAGAHGRAWGPRPRRTATRICRVAPGCSYGRAPRARVGVRSGRGSRLQPLPGPARGAVRTAGPHGRTSVGGPGAGVGLQPLSGRARARRAVRTGRAPRAHVGGRPGCGSRPPAPALICRVAPGCSVRPTRAGACRRARGAPGPGPAVTRICARYAGEDRPVRFCPRLGTAYAGRPARACPRLPAPGVPGRATGGPGAEVAPSARVRGCAGARPSR